MSVPRAERLQQIMTLQRQGLTHAAIGRRLGLARSTVNAIICDPDGSKTRARKKQYAGVCVECGGATDGGNGRGKASLRCIYCAQGKPRPAPPDRRRCVPVKLTAIPAEIRYQAAREACRIERGDKERQDILFAAIFPSETLYWVAPNPAADLWQAA